MRIAAKILFPSRRIVFSIAVYLILIFNGLSLMAGQRSITITTTGKSDIETGLQPIAFDSDSVYCDGRPLIRGKDYTINVHSGRLTLIIPPRCDTITLTAFQIPQWLMSSSGNPVPEGRRLIDIDAGSEDYIRPAGKSSQRISLSGNKSFSFTVGRSGEGRFSQGLNVDFDARVADDLRLRGSVSDRVGSGNRFLPGEGGTLVLSELDKYFFEIEGSRFLARGGDINAVKSKYLPDKRITGIYASYEAGPVGVAADFGRPAGKFISQKLMGVDGRQGPYQAIGADGAPTGVVPGSENVYVDGRLLEAGVDKHYLIDYPAGRITFSPRILITSRSRIEIDFEAASNDYEQVIFDGSGKLNFWGGRLKFSAGGRRESDEKDNMRFGSLASSDIQALQNAGDIAARAYVDGAIPDTAGNYFLVTDSLGNQYYQHAGSDTGDYAVTFSYVGENEGDYHYLGGGVYQYVGSGIGNYLPIRYLTLPVRNDFFYSAVELIPYNGGVWRLEYQGNDRDKNLFSRLDDGDNFRSDIFGQATHNAKNITSRFDIRYRQAGYDPAYRTDPPDDSRQWALPVIRLNGDELRLHFGNDWKTRNNHIAAEMGYLNFKNNVRSYRLDFKGTLMADKRVSPRFYYWLGNSKKPGADKRDGLFEKYNPALSIKVVKSVRLDLDYERELVKNRFDSIPDIERYSQYRGSVFAGHNVLSVSHRVEYKSGDFGFKGPQQNKVELTSEEKIGRLQISFAGTWFNQKKLDSDREDRTERLFVTSFRYAPSSAWITLRAEYRQNCQSVRKTGFRYIQVNSGEGDYRLEEDRYLYDPDGDYIRIREELGGATSVSAGEKNHDLMLYPGRVPLLKASKEYFSQIAFRLRTEVIEEMTGRDRRTVSWLLPWASRSGIPYIRRIRREKYSCLLFPVSNFYILNFSYANSFEEQESGGLVFRNNREYEIELKNQLSPTVRSFLDWKSRNDEEFGAAAIALDLETNTFTAGLIINPRRLQVTPAVSYIRFSERLYGGKGRGMALATESIWRHQEKGDVRFNMEVWSLTEEIPFSQPEYLVTDGRRFGRSALFSLVINYEIGEVWRLTVHMTDRIYEDRPAEFVGRGELLARF